MGMNWFKRKYATSTSWADEIKIYVEGNVLEASGIRGPLAEPFQFTMNLDNETLSDIKHPQEKVPNETQADVLKFGLTQYKYKYRRQMKYKYRNNHK